MSPGTGPARIPMEPFKIKVVEALPDPTLEQREAALARSGYNLFHLRSDEVRIDLLTDSGTAAMSDRQWAGMMLGDESYAGSRNFQHFEAVVQEITGFPFAIPVHQGRAAEHLLMGAVARPGSLVPNNMHFDTTQAHVRNAGARPVNVAIREAYDPENEAPFKGNADVARLEQLLRREGPDRVSLVLMTLTNNTGGGQPASLANLEQVSHACRGHGVPFYLDMCRWAENAYFIRSREPGCAELSIAEIGHRIFGLADGATMSAKKDGLVNIGGFVATRDAALAAQLKEALILYEGFPTYGGLARRDLEAMSIGLREAMELSYLEHRVGQIRYLAERLDEQGIPFVRPPGGHGVYLDARRFLPHLEDAQLPGQSLAVEIYREGGVRTVEVGEMMFHGVEGNPPELPALDLVRLAIPRRVYTQSHLDYVAQVVGAVYARRGGIRGLKIVEQPDRLPHFLARFAPLEPAQAPESPAR